MRMRQSADRYRRFSTDKLLNWIGLQSAAIFQAQQIHIVVLGHENQGSRVRQEYIQEASKSTIFRPLVDSQSVALTQYVMDFFPVDVTKDPHGLPASSSWSNLCRLKISFRPCLSWTKTTVTNIHQHFRKPSTDENVASASSCIYTLYALGVLDDLLPRPRFGGHASISYSESTSPYDTLQALTRGCRLWKVA